MVTNLQLAWNLRWTAEFNDSDLPEVCAIMETLPQKATTLARWSKDRLALSILRCIWYINESGQPVAGLQRILGMCEEVASNSHNPTVTCVLAALQTELINTGLYPS